MVLKLYGPDYANVRRPALILHEKQVPFELINVDMAKGEHLSPEYLEKQPFGEIPYIDDDGFILYESRAIGHYIASKYANQGTPGLIPTDIKANALFHQALSIEQWDFHDHAAKAFFEKVQKPMKGLQTDQAVFDRHIATLNEKLDVYEKILSKQNYLAGNIRMNEITLADLYHIPMGSVMYLTGVSPLEDEKRPNVLRWWKDITSRPSWQALKDGTKSTA